MTFNKFWNNVTTFIIPGKGKQFQRKSKPPKKREEKEHRGKGRQQEDELRDALADDDSSSTTTETSNPDTEAVLKEVQNFNRNSLDSILKNRNFFNAFSKKNLKLSTSLQFLSFILICFRINKQRYYLIWRSSSICCCCILKC